MNQGGHSPGDVHVPQPVRSQALIWLGTALVLILVLALLGLAMRIGQSGLAFVRPDYFYSFMTLHGLGMAGSAFLGALGGAWLLLARYTPAYTGAMWASFALILLGTVGLVTATLLGQYGAGWYVLYPLPFLNNIWTSWASPLSHISLLVLGSGWLLAQIVLLFGLVGRYGTTNLLGWQYLRKTQPGIEIPPLVLITTVSLIAGIVATVAGAAMLLLYLAKGVEPSLNFDALLMKNLVFLFGHTIVNITMYLGLAMVYEILPAYSGRPWKTNRIVVISWNLVLLFVLGAYFHHLYMDFAQPVSLHYLGQIMSYASAVPATAVTVFGVITQIHRSGMRWSFVPVAMFLGVVGWVIGGFAAVVDSTIAINVVYHNTLWVPAHFHTYFVMGYLLILLAATYHVVCAEETQNRFALRALVTMLVGGWGFLLMFYVAGALGVPRRYASYQFIMAGDIPALGSITAAVAGAFVILFLAGYVAYLVELVRARNRYATLPSVTATPSISNAIPSRR